MRFSVRFGSEEFSDSEPGKFAIPEDRVLTLDGQPVDGSFGECELGSSRHRIESLLESVCSKGVDDGKTMATPHSAGPHPPSVRAVIPFITA